MATAVKTKSIKVVKRKPQDFDALVDAPVTPPRPKSTDSVSDEVAQSSFFYKNYPVTELRSASTYAARLWHVDRFYPRAQGKPLYIDFVRELADKDAYQKLLEAYRQRAEAMRGAELRYAFVTHDMDVNDVLEQLGEL